MLEVISFFCTFWFIMHLMGLIGIANVGIDMFNLFNPVRNYRTWTSMNWFGVTLGTMFFHVLFPVYAVVYWFYKFCTFGRKQE